MNETLLYTLNELAILIECEVEAIKQDKKEKRSLMSKLAKANEMNIQLGLETQTTVEEMINSHAIDISESDKYLRQLKLVKYRINSSMSILLDEEQEEQEEQEEIEE